MTERGDRVKVFGRWATWDDAAEGLKGRLPADDVARLADAYRFAEHHHQGQTRPAGETYVRHLLEVVEILAIELGITDVEMLAAGLLHDVVEDTDGTLPDIAERFGSRTADLVGHVTMPEVTPGQAKATVRQTYLARLRDAPVDVLRLKLADRYSNVQRLHTHPKAAKQRSYYAETVEHFVPLAKVDDRLAELFDTWAEEYSYLDAENAKRS